VSNVTQLYLIKAALHDGLGFMLRKPLSSKQPDVYTQEDRETMARLYGRLPPNRRRTVATAVLARRSARR
jgi:hypothetical protein